MDKLKVILVGCLLFFPLNVFASQAHLGELNTNNKVKVIFHVDTPILELNLVGKPFVDCVVTIGKNVTVLEEGALPTQITTQEKGKIEAGQILEFEADITVQSPESLEGDIRDYYENRIPQEVDELRRDIRYLGQEYNWGS